MLASELLFEYILELDTGVFDKDVCAFSVKEYDEEAEIYEPLYIAYFKLTNGEELILDSYCEQELESQLQAVYDLLQALKYTKF